MPDLSLNEWVEKQSNDIKRAGRSLSELVGEYIAAYRAKKDLERKTKPYTEELNRLEPIILEQMAEEGVDSIKMMGSNVHIKERVWAKIVAVNREEAVQAVKDAGFLDLVKEDFNLNQLSSFVSEYYREGKELPLEFAGKIEANPTYSLGVTKA